MNVIQIISMVPRHKNDWFWVVKHACGVSLWMLQICHQGYGLEQLLQLNSCGLPLQWTLMKQIDEWRSMYAALIGVVFQLNQPMDLDTVLLHPTIIELELFLYCILQLNCFFILKIFILFEN